MAVGIETFMVSNNTNDKMILIKKDKNPWPQE